jgi:hypothetical protein
MEVMEMAAEMRTIVHNITNDFNAVRRSKDTGYAVRITSAAVAVMA